MGLKPAPALLNLRHRLTFKVFLTALMCSFVFVGISTILQVWLDFQAETAEIKQSVKLIERGYLPSIADSVYKLDEPQIRLLLLGVLQLRGIEYCQVFGDGFNLAEGNSKGLDNIEYKYPVSYESHNGQLRNVGTLTVRTGYQSYWYHFLHLKPLSILINAFQIFLTASIMFIIFHFFVSRHLITMAAYAKELSFDNLDPVLELDRQTEPDEIEMVVGAINDLRKRLKQDIEKRSRQEEELSKYRKSLEQMVADRTAELKATQQALVEKEKMAVLGQLTATVSHELRNPLGVIRSSNYFLFHKLEGLDEKAKKHFNRIDDQIALCDTIVADLLEYTEGRHVKKENTDLAGWLAEMVLVQQKSEGFDIHLQIPSDMAPIAYDQEKMHRVMQNVIANACHAVIDKHKESKRLGVSYTPNIEIKVNRDDDHLHIIIQDNGIGMDPNQLSQAFKPLFTTRAQGTGIGLAIVKKIVEEHDGAVTMESAAGKGTMVRITLPLKEA